MLRLPMGYVLVMPSSLIITWGLHRHSQTCRRRGRFAHRSSSATLPSVLIISPSSSPESTSVFCQSLMPVVIWRLLLRAVGRDDRDYGPAAELGDGGVGHEYHVGSLGDEQRHADTEALAQLYVLQRRCCSSAAWCEASRLYALHRRRSLVFRHSSGIDGLLKSIRELTGSSCWACRRSLCLGRLRLCLRLRNCGYLYGDLVVDYTGRDSG